MRRLMSVVFIVVILLSAVAREGDTETVNRAYDISVRTYQNVQPVKYHKIYKQVQRVSKPVMVDAARDACLESGEDMKFYGPGNGDRSFDCSSY